jgi:hypothetical protein
LSAEGAGEEPENRLLFIEDNPGMSLRDRRERLMPDGVPRYV